MTSRAPTAVNTTLRVRAVREQPRAARRRARRSDAACGDRILDYTWRIDGGAPIQVTTPTHTIAALSDGPQRSSPRRASTSGNVSGLRREAARLVWNSDSPAGRLGDVNRTVATASRPAARAPPPAAARHHRLHVRLRRRCHHRPTRRAWRTRSPGSAPSTSRCACATTSATSRTGHQAPTMTSLAIRPRCSTAPAQRPVGSTSAQRRRLDRSTAAAALVNEWTWRVDAARPS